jgi:hypothetical protein
VDLSTNPRLWHDVPVSVTPETLKSWLDEIGWASRMRDATTFECSHKTSEGKFTLFIRLMENWVVASVVPFLATKGDNSLELARWLLRQNRDLYQAKFAYDEDGDVVMTVELPTESLDPSEAQGALVGLLDAAVKHRRTLRLASGVKTPLHLL